MFRILFYVFVTLSAKSFAVLQSQFNNCDYLDHVKAFKVCWAYNQSTDIVNFALDVKTLGWVGFGFAHKIHKMQNYDVIVGKIQNGKESLTVNLYKCLSVRCLTLFELHICVFIVVVIVRTHCNVQ